jgi:hypothetical protein
MLLSPKSWRRSSVGRRTNIVSRKLGSYVQAFLKIRGSLAVLAKRRACPCCAVSFTAEGAETAANQQIEYRRQNPEILFFCFPWIRQSLRFILLFSDFGPPEADPRASAGSRGEVLCAILAQAARFPFLKSIASVSLPQSQAIKEPL